MSFRSLREYIARVDQMGELQRIAGARGKLTNMLKLTATAITEKRRTITEYNPHLMEIISSLLRSRRPPKAEDER